MDSLIIGFGSALPEKCVKNADLPKSLDTSDEWIVQRTGIKQRYIADNGETTGSLAVEAALDAIEFAEIDKSEIDLIIVATVTPDYTFPSTACFVQRAINVENCISLDVSAACSGFVYALDIADAYIKLGKAKCALVIGSETFSKIVDWSDRSSCVLFGDGAGAVVVKSSGEATCEDVPYSPGIKYCKLYSDGKFVESLITTGGVSTNQQAGIVLMNGREVFKFAVEKFKESLLELLHANHMTVQDIDLLVPHQANARIIEKLMLDLSINREKVLITVDNHANTSAASIPLALCSIKNDVFKKKNVILLSMGAGFTWGAMLINF